MTPQKAAAPRTVTQGALAHSQILDAAEELFYQEGARSSGIDAVVKRAGVNKMSLYRQFESKDDLLKQYLQRRDEKFLAYLHASLDKHPGQPRRQLEQFFTDLAARTATPGYRGCPFVNIAAEFPDTEHFARQMVAGNKARLLATLTELAQAAGASDAPGLAAGLALLIEGAYTASQTYAPGNSLLPALPLVAKILLDAALPANT
ncbi:TetR/AcrR family transcriptional regulator [Silvimonas soli]|uniref:TetR/AcrR family transcriptional regulator n=1 Tax=Silvimonas soli TaxID=2980100 RepID=UPI0024B39116|nr:TetR/AcrR family transcriptional regulator [Silvimonas soli]